MTAPQRLDAAAVAAALAALFHWSADGRGDVDEPQLVDVDQLAAELRHFAPDVWAFLCSDAGADVDRELRRTHRLAAVALVVDARPPEDRRRRDEPRHLVVVDVDPVMHAPVDRADACTHSQRAQSQARAVVRLLTGGRAD